MSHEVYSRSVPGWGGGTGAAFARSDRTWSTNARRNLTTLRGLRPLIVELFEDRKDATIAHRIAFFSTKDAGGLKRRPLITEIDASESARNSDGAVRGNLIQDHED